MPYVQRATDGTITSIFSAKQIEGQEYLPDDDPEVIAYFEVIEHLTRAPSSDATRDPTSEVPQ